MTTYQQIGTQYLLPGVASATVPVDMSARYRGVPTSVAAVHGRGYATGTTDGLDRRGQHRPRRVRGLHARDATVAPYGSRIAQLSAEEAARVKVRYDRLQLADAGVVHGLEALGVCAVTQT